jgi:TonB family protein
MTDPLKPDRKAAGDPYAQLTEAEEDALEGDGQSFLRRHGPAIGVGFGSVLVGVGLLAVFLSDDTPPTRRVQDFTIVNVVPPPPPPPPPEQQPQPEEQEMIEQPKLQEQEIKEELKEEKVDSEDPSNDLPPSEIAGLGEAGDGPGDASFGAGNGLGRGSGNSGTRWGWYATIVQQQLEAAIRNNPKTRNAMMQVKVRVWADRTGRISRVQLDSSSGDPEVDAAIRSELPSIALREPPPSDMPMPIVTRITARRSG